MYMLLGVELNGSMVPKCVLSKVCVTCGPGNGWSANPAAGRGIHVGNCGRGRQLQG